MRPMRGKEGKQGTRKAFSPAVTIARAAVEREALPRDSSVLTAAHNKAQSDLAALEAEQAAIPAAGAVARGNRDLLRHAHLIDRAAALQLAIHAARIAVMESLIAQMRARVNETKAHGTVASLREEQARLELERALSAYSNAVAVRKSYVDADYVLRLELLERERELQQLRAEP